MKKLLTLLLLPLFALSMLLSGCNGKSSANGTKNTITHPRDLDRHGTVIGVPMGATAMRAAEKFFKNATIQVYDSVDNGYADVKDKKIDAFVFDRHNVEYKVKSDPTFASLPVDIGEEHIVVGMPLGREQLRAEVNRFIETYRSDGTYYEMYERWFSGSSAVMPTVPEPESPTRTLKIVTEGNNVPMNYRGKDGKLTGFDLEFGKRLGLFLNASVTFEALPFEAAIDAVEAGQFDLFIASLNATPERMERILVSDDYLDSTICLLVHKDRLSDKVKESKVITTVADLSGKRVAYPSGSVLAEVTKDYVKNVDFRPFADDILSLEAVRAGKVDALLTDEPIARLLVSKFPDDLRIASVYAKDSYGFAFKQGSPMVEEFNKVIAELKRTGEIKRLTDKWCGPDDSKKVLEKWTHKKDFTGKRGKLRFAGDAVMEPMCYVGRDGQYMGLDIEIMARIAYELDMTMDFVSINFDALLEAVTSGKVDVIGGSMSITDERREKVDFTDWYYIGGMTIVTKRTANAEKKEAITRISQLYGKRIGVLYGTAMDRITRDFFLSSKAVHFDSFFDLPVALESGKIDAFLLDEPQANNLIHKKSGFTVLPKRLSTAHYAFLFGPEEKTLSKAFSDQIRTMKENGTLKKLQEKWFSSDPTEKKMPKPKGEHPNGVLRFATMDHMEPFSFAYRGEIVGYNIELAQTIAENLGYGLEPVVLEWNEYLNAVSSGTVRFGAACNMVTDARKLDFLFSDPIYSGKIMVVVADVQAADGGFPIAKWCMATAKRFVNSFDRTFIRENRWKLILQGLGVTVIITVFSAIFGTLLSPLVCAMRMSKRKRVVRIARGYISIMQGTPLLVILMILYYIVFAKIDISAIIVAIITFSLNFSAYIGEMLRMGITSIPKGQTEAALALGYPKYKAFLEVIFPQVLRQILPVYRNEFVLLLKSTSIVGYIAIQDLAKMSDIIRGRTYEAFFPLITTAVIYFAIANALAYFLVWLEVRFDPQKRREAGRIAK